MSTTFSVPEGSPGETLFMDQEEQPRGALAVPWSIQKLLKFKKGGPACACRGAPGHAGRGCRADVGCEHAPLPQAFVSRSQDMPRNKIIMSGLRRRSSDGKRQRRWDITDRSYWRPPRLFDRSSTGWTNYDPKICQKVIGQVML